MRPRVATWLLLNGIRRTTGKRAPLCDWLQYHFKRLNRFIRFVIGLWKTVTHGFDRISGHTRNKSHPREQCSDCVCVAIKSPVRLPAFSPDQSPADSAQQVLVVGAVRHINTHHVAASWNRLPTSFDHPSQNRPAVSSRRRLRYRQYRKYGRGAHAHGREYPPRLRGQATHLHTCRVRAIIVQSGNGGLILRTLGRALTMTGDGHRLLCTARSARSAAIAATGAVVAAIVARAAAPAPSWGNAPAGSKGFGLLVHDPDAPTGSGC
jgi:hypothetical protein